MPHIRLLIVDDSAIMRRALQQAAETDPDIEIVGTAVNGREGAEKAAALRPDVVTMDVEMPVMNGLDAVAQIMRTAPTRILMVSSLTTAGADTTMEALDRGAVDVLAKPVGTSGLVQLTDLQRRLVPAIRAAAAANLDALRRRPAAPARPAPPGGAVPRAKPPAPVARIGARRIVLIGTSTGGPHALQTVIPALSASLPAGVLIVQHMPPLFTAQLARRLDRLSELEVKEAEEGDEVRPGRVLLAPGDRHLVLREAFRVGLDEEPADADHRPSVDVLFHSATPFHGGGATAVVLTGMGRDGCTGAAALKEKGARIVAQDEDTSVVFGMPGAVVGAGLADSVCPLTMVAGTIQRALRS